MSFCLSCYSRPEQYLKIECRNDDIPMDTTLQTVRDCYWNNTGARPLESETQDVVQQDKENGKPRDAKAGATSKDNATKETEESKYLLMYYSLR